MKSASAGLIAHLAQEYTTLAWCWKVTRMDSQVFGFSNHDRDLTFGGVTYRADSGLSSTAAQARAGGAVDNMEIQGFFAPAGLTEADLLAGVWDGAEVLVQLVNWADPGQGAVVVQRARLGRMSLRGGLWVAEILSLSADLARPVGRSMSRRCSADLGDSRCGVNLAAWTVAGIATADSPGAQTFSASSLPASPGGLLTWTSGDNAGRSMEIRQSASGQITLSLPMPSAIAAGDAYSAQAGCDKNPSVCSGTFANIVRFRGFPHIPGRDALLDYPDAR